MPAPIDLTGQNYNALHVLYKVPSQTRQTKWMCKCRCGKFVIVETRNIRGGVVKSCGCLSNYYRTKNNPNVTHRQSYSPTYKSWMMMRSRCDNPNYTAYSYYGGRGISYDPRWKDFSAFLADMGKRPEGLTLDRIDSDKDYGPNNCRWATREEQVDNRSNNIYFTGFGRTLSLKEWAGLAGATRKELYGYMYRHWLWDIEMVLSDLGLSQGVQENMRLAVD